MKPHPSFPGFTWRSLLHAKLALPTTLMLAMTACGSMQEGSMQQEDAQSSEPVSTAIRTDALNVDECATGADNCSINATCTDTAEGFTCTCKEDFAGDGVTCTRVSYSVVLEPVADSTVSAYSPTTNFGTSPELVVDRNVQEAWLRFDLSALPAKAHVKSVKLQALAYTGYAWGGDGNVYTYLVPDDTWGETTITWNNKPAVSGGALGAWFLWFNGAYEDKLGVNSDPALAAAVQAEFSGDKTISLRLNSPGYRTNYRSREFTNANQRPKLIVTYTLVKVLEPVADSTVSAYSPTTNFGTSQELVVEQSYQESYLRFDLSGLPGNAQISSTSLEALAYTGYAWGGDGNVYTYLVPDDTWGETTITWNNKPAVSGSALGAWFLWFNGAYEDKLGVNSDPALASAVRTELSGDKTISLRLNSPGYRTNYRSREFTNANQRPKLKVFYVEPL